MTISFACPSCAKAYSVDASLAGRAGKCKACGRAMTVPVGSQADPNMNPPPYPPPQGGRVQNIPSPLVGEGRVGGGFERQSHRIKPPPIDDDEDGIATEGYGLTEPDVAPAIPEEASVFTRAKSDPSSLDRPRPRPTSGKKKRKKLEHDEPFVARHRRALIALPIVLAVVLLVVALAVPKGLMIASGVIAAVGGVMILVGFWVGAYAAFTEDTLYGFLYLVIPLYTGYYLLTRWDDMWPWFVAMTVGVGLVGLGGAMMGVGLDDDPAPPPAQVRNFDEERSVPPVVRPRGLNRWA